LNALVFWVWFGCAGSTAPTATQSNVLKTPPVPGTSEPKDTDCIDQCKRQNMARAVSAEQIAEDCAQQCSQSEKNTLQPLLIDDPK